MLQIFRVSTVLFGLAAFAVGVWRQLETGTSPQAAWFGLVMGGLAIIGALILTGRARALGWVLICTSLVFVSGWFLQRMISGHAEGKSVRVILILVFCAVETALLVVTGLQAIAARKTKSQQQEK